MFATTQQPHLMQPMRSIPTAGGLLHADVLHVTSTVSGRQALPAAQAETRTSQFAMFMYVFRSVFYAHTYATIALRVVVQDLRGLVP